jgi:hypothetical protein
VTVDKRVSQQREKKGKKGPERSKGSGDQPKALELGVQRGCSVVASRVAGPGCSQKRQRKASALVLVGSKDPWKLGSGFG